MCATNDRIARDDDLLAIWRERFESPVAGWDFTGLDGEMTEEAPPWSYEAEALPDDTVATEGWPPNVPIATDALATEGVDVVVYDAEADPAMPFPENRFDLVLNRHEAYVAVEVHRVLRRGGWFVTQQVDGRSFDETQRLFGGSSDYAHVTLANFSRQAEDAGFVIERVQEWAGKLMFESVAAMVRYFAIVPWEVPDDFSVDRYAETLLDLHRSGADLVFTQRRFLLIARA